ncbi:MAG: L,D-transpeptidase ErfK/SrfK [Thermoleophilaceae bacterium]|jgi:lipoprotein-anchoring transpeptidase ErfK/SrfK|nr:L,D-transpeptidase ErfK/SrfK [Thermoleophilaceae bacterium]
MGQRSFIFLAVVLAVMIFGSVGVYAYDSSNNKIADGITAAGIDIGGMSKDAARAKLRHELDYNLERPLKVRRGHRTFTLDPKTARVKTNVDSMVDQAVDRSHQGNVLSRSIRKITGGKVHEDIPVRVTFDRRAVTALVKRVKRKTDQPAVDASVSFSGGAVQPVPGHIGHQLDSGRLQSQIEAALVEPSSERVVRARVVTTKPKVTTRQLASTYPKILVVNKSANIVTLYVNLKPDRTYHVATGSPGYPTPSGRFAIQSKQIDPIWHVPNSSWAGSLAGRDIPPGPQNPLKARWMGITGGAGFHGTADIGSIGTSASHGCVRMLVADVIDLFGRVDVGTPVFVT